MHLDAKIHLINGYMSISLSASCLLIVNFVIFLFFWDTRIGDTLSFKKISFFSGDPLILELKKFKDTDWVP